MSTNPTEVEERTDLSALDARDVRALTEAMYVYDDAPAVSGAEDLYVVYSGSSEYTVDLREPACECPDYQHRSPEGGCKHIRRVQYRTGERTVPEWVDLDAIDAPLREIVAKRRRAAQYHKASRARTDGGESEARGECPCPECDECEACEALSGAIPCAECFIQHSAPWSDKDGEDGEDGDHTDATMGVEA